MPRGTEGAVPGGFLEEVLVALWVAWAWVARRGGKSSCL